VIYVKTDFESIAAITEYPVYNKPDPVAIASHQDSGKIDKQQ
jgi:hypothetical protein